MYNKINKIISMCIVSLIMTIAAISANAQDDGKPSPFSADEVLNIGHKFFDLTSSGLAEIIERNAKTYGLPNGYILGEEASGAFIGGLRYGEGTLYTKNAGDHKVYWQGPSLGWDWGGDGNRTMMLVYNLTSTDAIHRRFLGISGSAFFIGGFGVTALKHGDKVLVPVRTGVGARLGVNVGYLKIRPEPTWNPF